MLGFPGQCVLASISSPLTVARPHQRRLYIPISRLSSLLASFIFRFFVLLVLFVWFLAGFSGFLFFIKMLSLFPLRRLCDRFRSVMRWWGEEPWEILEECARERTLMERRTSGLRPTPTPPPRIILWWWSMEFLGGIVFMDLWWSYCVILLAISAVELFYRWLRCLFVFARQHSWFNLVSNLTTWI